MQDVSAGFLEKWRQVHKLLLTRATLRILSLEFLVYGLLGFWAGTGTCLKSVAKVGLLRLSPYEGRGRTQWVRDFGTASRLEASCSYLTVTGRSIPNATWGLPWFASDGTKQTSAYSPAVRSRTAQ